MTITILDDFAVEASQEYDFVDEDGFVIPTRGDGGLSSFWNFGVITLNVDGGSAYGEAVVNCADGAPGSVIENARGGLMQVTATNQSYVIGIEADAYGPKIINDGTIEIDSTYQADGIRYYGSDPSDTVINNGLIKVRGDVDAGGISFGYGGTIENHGKIHVHGADAVGVSPGESEFHFENTGKIVVHSIGAPDGVGVDIYAFDAGSTFVNEGLIEADFAIRGDVSGQTLTNDGTLIGDVWLGGYRQGFINTGLVRGDILLGYGDDHFDGSAGKLIGAVYGGGGSDLLVCGAGDQTIYGDGIPEGGNDGRDTLIGGAGSDTLTGGGGADTYMFQKLSDSLVGAADLITDLAKKDVIDLSAIDADTTQAGDQAFHLVAALDGHAGEAALTYDASRDVTLLQLDVDGNGAADAEISIAGDHTGFSNFVL